MNHKIRCISIFCVYRGTYTQVYKLVYRELKSRERNIYISQSTLFLLRCNSQRQKYSSIRKEKNRKEKHKFFLSLDKRGHKQLTHLLIVKGVQHPQNKALDFSKFSFSINWVLIGKKRNCYDSWDFNITLRACYGWLLSSPAKASHSGAQAWRWPRLVPDLQERAATAA